MFFNIVLIHHFVIQVVFTKYVQQRNDEPQQECYGVIKTCFGENLFLNNRVSDINHLVIGCIACLCNCGFRTFLQQVGINGVVQFVFTLNTQQLPLCGRQVAEKA